MGLYPLGASKTGVLDMAGTIYEWCRNAFDDPDNIGFPATSEDLRVLRGGSWYDNQGGARCANRAGYVPFSRSNHLGFRVLCSSPIVDP